MRLALELVKYLLFVHFDSLHREILGRLPKQLVNIRPSHSILLQ